MLVLCLLMLIISVAQTATAPCSGLKSEAAFLAEITAGLPRKVRASFCDVGVTGKHTVHPDATGISHFVLPGLIPKHLIGDENDKWKVVRHRKQAELEGVADSEPALLHLWLRAACTGAETTVRGFGMLQGSAESKESIHGEFELDLQLVSLPGMPTQQHMFKVYWRDKHEATRYHSPFTVETAIPFEQTAPHYRIRVGGFSEQAHLTFTPQVSSCSSVVRRERPALLTVLTHSYATADSPENLELMAQNLVAHVKHHLKLGLVGTVHYEADPYLSYLATHTEVQALIQQGTLRLIQWDMEIQLENAFGILLTKGIWHVERSKVLQYNHAMLAHWGLDVYINPLDNDEFLATNKPTNVSEMLANGCIMPEGHTTALRYDIRCGTCQGVEGDLWLSEKTGNPLSHYNETDWRVRLRGKPVLHADNSFSMAIHEAGVFHHGQEHHSYCFFHLHMVNLYSVRRDRSDTEFTSDISWNWVL